MRGSNRRISQAAVGTLIHTALNDTIAVRHFYNGIFDAWIVATRLSGQHQFLMCRCLGTGQCQCNVASEGCIGLKQLAPSV